MSLNWITDTDSDGTPGTGTKHDNAWLQSIRTALEITMNKSTATALSASDVNITAAGLGGGIVAMLANATFGGVALVVFQVGASPAVAIAAQVGPTVWTVSAPAAGEIRILESSSRLAIRAGATRNGNVIYTTYFAMAA